MTNDFPKTYKKAIKGTVGGRYINSRDELSEFLLRGDPTDPKNFDDVVVEVTTAEADKYFKKENKSALLHGYIIEVSEGVELNLDKSNAVTDGELKDILKQPFTKMKNRVSLFTSSVPVERLLDLSKKENAPIKTVEYISSVLATFTSKPSSSINSGDVKVSSM